MLSLYPQPGSDGYTDVDQALIPAVSPTMSTGPVQLTDRPALLGFQQHDPGDSGTNVLSLAACHPTFDQDLLRLQQIRSLFTIVEVSHGLIDVAGGCTDEFFLTWLKFKIKMAIWTIY